RDEAVHYRVSMDTSLLAGRTGYVDLQFNSAGVADGSVAYLEVSGFTAPGATLGGHSSVGDTMGDVVTGLSMRSGSVLNQFKQAIAFGDEVQFDVRLTGSAVSMPAHDSFGLAFAVQVLDGDGITPLLTKQRSGSLVQLNLDPDGTIEVVPTAIAQSSGP